ncbi:MAG: inorganic phosphate transporter [Pseudomonadota bacterium]
MLLLSKRSNLLRFGLTLGFLLGVTTTIGLFFNHGTVPLALILAVLFGGYMAITIGANDAANNLGAPVGSKALTLTSALIIAIVFESAGALIAGGDVMNTIKGEIINPALIRNQEDFVWLMLSALLAAALWIHLATALGAPVSTTHSIIGGIVGAGITVGGLGIANWSKIAAIASSWIISPLLGGLIAAAFLYLIKNTLTYRENMSRAAIRVVPILVAAMAWAFSAYLILKGFKQIWQVDFMTAILASLVIAVGLYLIIQPAIAQAADRLPQSKIEINRLFNIPLFFAAALLSFAHGANDVANVVGPIAAIHEVMLGFGVSELASIPLWIMLIGVSGLALGLVLYGPKLIKVIGSEITELDQIRAYCIVMAVSITIILASEFSIPVSSTHITVGAVFGVGFLREYLKSHHAETREKITRHLEGKKLSLIHHFMDEFYQASLPEKRKMLKQLEIHSNAPELSKKERKELRKLYRQELVKRSTFLKIVIAWLITLPIAGIFASLLYLLIQMIK